MIICFDLNGPVLDVSARYWHVYRDVLAELGKSALPLAEYWALKRTRTPEADILRRTNAQDMLEEYTRLRIACVETPHYLQYDRVWRGVRPALVTLRQKHRLLLITMRRSAEALHQQLKTLHLLPLFHHVLCAPRDGAPGERAEVKVVLVRDTLGPQTRTGWFVGDTETDIRAGQMLGLRTAAVTFGIRTAEELMSAGPDVLIHSPTELVEWAKTCVCDGDGD